MMQCMLIAWWSIWCNALLCGKSELKCGSGHCYHKMRMEDGGGDYSLQGLFPLLFISQDKRSREYLSTHVGEDHYRGNYASCDHTKARWCVWSLSTVQAHTNTTCTIKNKLWLKTSAGDGKGTEKVLNKDKSTSVKLPVPQGRLHTYTVKQLFIWRQFYALGPTQLRNQQFKTGYCHRYPIMHIRTYVCSYHRMIWKKLHTYNWLK